MKCPNCDLLNPPSALRCDCGYDFPSGTMKASYAHPSGTGAEAETGRRSTWLALGGAAALGGVVTIIIGVQVGGTPVGHSGVGGAGLLMLVAAMPPFTLLCGLLLSAVKATRPQGLLVLAGGVGGCATLGVLILRFLR